MGARFTSSCALSSGGADSKLRPFFCVCISWLSRNTPTPGRCPLQSPRLLMAKPMDELGLFLFQQGRYAEAYWIARRLRERGIQATIITRHVLQVSPGDAEAARAIMNEWVLERAARDPGPPKE